MAITFDAATRNPTTDTTGFNTTSGPKTFSHAGSASATALAVVVSCDATTAPVTAVLYGLGPQIALTLVADVTDTTEAGRVQIWFTGDVGVNSLGGTQTVTMNGPTTGPNMWASAVSFTSGASSCQLEATATQNTVTSASAAVNWSVAPTHNFHWVAGASGGDAAPTTMTISTPTNTTLHSADYGTRSARTWRATAENSVGGTSITFDHGASDDWCLAAIAISEVGGAPATGLPILVMAPPLPA